MLALFLLFFSIYWAQARVRAILSRVRARLLYCLFFESVVIYKISKIRISQYNQGDNREIGW